jgi:dTDP-4-dehydrorhamnose 3,5-epimerase
LFDDRETSNTQFQEVIISKDNFCRLTVPPMIWMGFQGLSDNESILLNIASIEHDPIEAEKKNIEQIEFDWNK